MGTVLLIVESNWHLQKLRRGTNALGQICTSRCVDVVLFQVGICATVRGSAIRSWGVTYSVRARHGLGDPPSRRFETQHIADPAWLSSQ